MFGFPSGSDGKDSACNTEDLGSIPGLGRFPGEGNGWITNWNQDCQEKYQQPQIYRWYHSNVRKWRETKEPLDEGGRRLKRLAQHSTFKKTKIMGSDPITLWQIEVGKVKTMTDFTFLARKSLQMVTAAMKLEDTSSLERKLWQTCGCVCVQSLQSCPTLCNHMDCNPPGSSAHGTFQARILKWVAIPSSRESSQCRN